MNGTLKTLLVALVTTLALVVVSGGTSFAKSPREVVQTRQVNQQKRIAKGVASGQLTVKETVRLQKQQRHINRTKKRMLADDGRLDRQERRVLDRKQDRASARIYVNKHDRQKR